MKRTCLCACEGNDDKKKKEKKEKKKVGKTRQMTKLDIFLMLMSLKY